MFTVELGIVAFYPFILGLDEQQALFKQFGFLFSPTSALWNRQQVAVVFSFQML